MKNEIINKENKGGELIKIDRNEFVTKFDPVKMLTSYKHIKTVSQAIQEDKNGISFYSKHLGEDTILAVVELHLLALNQSVNVGQPLTKYQIKLFVNGRNLFYIQKSQARRIRATLRGFEYSNDFRLV